MPVPEEYQKVCHPLHFTAVALKPDPPHAEAIRVNVSRVLGSSTEVRPGERYVVSGEYTYNGEDDLSIRIVVGGKSQGHYETLKKGVFPFEVWAKILELHPDTPGQLSILLGDKADNELGLCARIELRR